MSIANNQELKRRLEGVGSMLRERRVDAGLSLFSISKQISGSTDLFIESIENGSVSLHKNRHKYFHIVSCYAKILNIADDQVLNYISESLDNIDDDTNVDYNHDLLISPFQSKKLLNVIVFVLLLLTSFSIIKGLQKNSYDGEILKKFNDN